MSIAISGAECKSSADVANTDLEIPTLIESQVFELVEVDDLTQDDIAKRLKISQAKVSRAYSACKAKIESLVLSGRFDRDEIDAVMRKMTGNHPKKFRIS